MDQTQIQDDSATHIESDGSRCSAKRCKRTKDADRPASKTCTCSQNNAEKACSVFQYIGDIYDRQKDSSFSTKNSELKLQKPAPFFEGVAVFHKQFGNISINDFKGRYLILYFYPLDFTFVCPTEIIAFSERIAEFDKIDCTIVGCSTDSQYAHLAWMNMERSKGGIGDLNYPLLSDKSMNIARSYGVLDEETGVPFRGLFVIDRNQILRQIIVNDLPIGRSVDEVLRLVQAMQSHEQNGEVCPVNWKPGSKTIVPDPKASLEFFKTSS